MSLLTGFTVGAVAIAVAILAGVALSVLSLRQGKGAAIRYLSHAKAITLFVLGFMWGIVSMQPWTAVERVLSFVSAVAIGAVAIILINLLADVIGREESES